MERVYLSVGFADMAHFSELPQQLGWERTIQVLQDTFKHVGDMVIAHNGRIHKYGGDALLFTCVDPRQAIVIAREIARYRYQVDQFSIRYYVAIATGNVFLTEIGHPTLLVKDIVGTPVLRANWLLAEAHQQDEGYALCSETHKYL